jgi:RNA polymerase sigma-70 factor (ECF subfamily)
MWVMRRLSAGDDQLLRRFGDGDPEGFVSFYRRHRAAMLGFFVRRTGDPELAADLTHEVFAAALLAAERYRPGERPALAWLYGIAAHKLADSRRRGRVEDEARRRMAFEPLPVEDRDLEQLRALADLDDGPVRDALLALPADQRDAVLARVIDERPYSEIAIEMVCSEMLARQRVSRGLRSLRTRIKEKP